MVIDEVGAVAYVDRRADRFSGVSDEIVARADVDNGVGALIANGIGARPRDDGRTAAAVEHDVGTFADVDRCARTKS